MRAAALILSALLVMPELLGAATIRGQIFTSEPGEPEAQILPLTLIFRDTEDQVQRIETATDSVGHYHFTDLSADTSIGYVIRIEQAGQELLSSPIHFDVGQDLIESNFQLPPPEHQHAPVGEPVEQNPIHALLILLGLLLLFLLAARAGQRSFAVSHRPRIPSGARQIAREIASLDRRFEQGVIEEAEYKKVRSSLLEQLRSFLQRQANG